MFIDEAVISVSSGKGGDGKVSFRHEKYVPRGGPDGGDGGRGANVYIKANPSMHGLDIFRHKKVFKAPNGEDGRSKKCIGAGGEDLYIEVPPGTVVRDDRDQLIVDIKNKEDCHLLLRGGRGGRGNVHFATSINRTPKEAEAGRPGQAGQFFLELRHIADVGIIGLPNAGKSTLIKTLTNAKPPVANYPFSSTEVMLGRLQKYDKSYILADIPGLIEGSSKGKGLGIKFLKHILRTRIIVHCISSEQEDLNQSYEQIRSELKQYHQSLEQKPQIIVITKSDLITDPKEWQKRIKRFKHPHLLISCANNIGLEELITQMIALDKKQTALYAKENSGEIIER